MALGDLETFFQWLQTPDVKPVWVPDSELAFDQVAQKYRSRIAGADGVRPFIFKIDGCDAGYIQSYIVDALPEGPGIPRLDRAAGVDIFIGEERWIHRGHGPVVLC